MPDKVKNKKETIFSFLLKLIQFKIVFDGKQKITFYYLKIH